MTARTWIAILAAAPWVAWAVMRALALDVAHPLTAAISFTPYVALSSPLPILFALALRRPAVALLATAAAAVLAVAVVPRALGGPDPVGDDARVVTVMAANLYGGRGDARRIMTLVRRHDVDVLSLLELTPDALAALDAEGAADVLPGRAAAPRPGGEGSGILARRPVTPVAEDSGDLPTQPSGDVALAGGETLRVKAIHPYPPVSRTRSQAWERELAELPSASADGRLRVLAGDFNATLDHRALRRVLDRGWTDAADAVGEGLHPTWPDGRLAPPITIDHVLAGPRLGVRGFGVHDVPGSDHHAVIARLVVPDG